jgi:ATP-dependent Lhr-like helicase
VSGRWSLVAAWRRPEVTLTERLSARVGVLLDRHGILTRETVAAEGLEGGFTAAYPVLRALEDAGRVRRGYFVAGRGAAQFARPGALDRLRALGAVDGPAEVIRLDATDPASPYGATLPWPERPAGRKPMRLAGALVILVDGALAGWRGPAERQVLTFADGVPDRSEAEVRAGVATALAAEPARTGRPLVIEEVDGQPAGRSPLAAALTAVGFLATPHGFLRRLGARGGDPAAGA